LARGNTCAVCDMASYPTIWSINQNIQSIYTKVIE
jgi:hypothetical protein